MLLKSNYLNPESKIKLPKDYIVSTDDIRELVHEKHVLHAFDTARNHNMNVQDYFLYLMKNNWAYAAQVLLSNPDDENPFELLSFQHAIIDILRNHSFPMFIASRGASKSMCLALYAVLKAVLEQDMTYGHKIVLVGSSFRQSKQIFSYIQEFMNRSPFLKVASQGGIKYHPDKVEVKFGNSVITGIPLGTGNSIRGIRANVILADEFSCLEPNTLIETDKGLMRLKDSFEYNGEFKVNTGNGTYEKPNKFIKTPLVDAYKITTKYGYTFTCSSIHQVMTKDGWKKGKDLTQNDYLLFKNDYVFPSEELISEYCAYELGRHTINNFIPDEILQSSHVIVRSFLRGLFNCELCEFTNYKTPHEQLSYDLHVLLRKLGIVCKRYELNDMFYLERDNKFPQYEEVYLKVSHVEKLPSKMHLYDYRIPVSQSFMGGGFMQHNSISKDIFDIVVRGFAAVSRNPVESAKSKSSIAKRQEQEVEEMNQVILSGTAYFKYNHFYTTYMQYRNIIRNKVLGWSTDYPEIFGRKIARFKVDYRKYAVIKLPYDKLPNGFLDADQLANAGIGMKNNAWFNMEYKTIFVSDTAGFFTMSSIDRNSPYEGQDGAFCPEISGDDAGIYVMGIDPARLRDNFALVIGKIIGDKIRVVYCETWHNKPFPTVTKQVRKLIDLFNIKLIHMDSGGGGTTVKDILCDRNYFPEDDLIIDMDDKELKHIAGRKILRLCIFSRPEWLENANYVLKNYIDTDIIKWPTYVDMNAYSKLSTADYTKTIEKAEDILGEINKIKVELSKIERTYTQKTQRAHFDVPRELKRTFRKDRYSALLMMVDAAHNLMHNTGPVKEETKELPMLGGWA